MQHQKFVKTASLLGATLAIIACTFLFSATSSVEHADSQSVKNLATEIAAMKAELATLKTAQAQGTLSDEGMMGEIRMFAGMFAPRGWAFCEGQILKIAENNALFSLLGTNFGGDGRYTFALPDLRGRTPVGTGRGQGLTETYLGRMSGTETTTVITTKIAVTPAQGRTQGTMAISDIPNGVSTMGPRASVNFIIAIQGIYPSRP